MKSQGRYILQLTLIHLFNSHPTDSPCWPSHVWGACERAIKEGGRKEMRARNASIIMSMCRGVDVIVFSLGYISVAIVNPHGLTLYLL